VNKERAVSVRFGKQVREGEYMGKTLEKWLEERNLKKWFRKDNLVILVLSGVLLFIIALPTRTEEGTGEGLFSEGEGIGETAGGGQEADSDAGEEYAAQMEKRLEEILGRMEGVGRVQVMITLESSEELIVEKEAPYSRSATTESDFQGGSRTINQTEMQDNTVYRTQGNSSEPYVVKTLTPKVQGVVVVAQGAGTGNVNRTIVELVQALFDIEAHKVRVVKMETADSIYP